MIVVYNQTGQWRLHNCGNTAEATTLLQQFIKQNFSFARSTPALMRGRYNVARGLLSGGIGEIASSILKTLNGRAHHTIFFFFFLKGGETFCHIDDRKKNEKKYRKQNRTNRKAARRSGHPRSKSCLQKYILHPNHLDLLPKQAPLERGEEGENI